MIVTSPKDLKTRSPLISNHHVSKLFHSKRTLVVQVNFLPWTLQIDTAEKKNRGFKVPIPECTTVHTSLVLIIRSSLDLCQYKRA